jgi:hypothetical protein
VNPWLKLSIGVLVAGVLAVIGATVFVGSKVREETVVERPYEEGLRQVERRRAPCDLGAGPCTARLPSGGEVTVELAPRPLRTMRDLQVRASVPSKIAPSEVSVAFSMPGMEMGQNRVRLEASPEGWKGTAVLVRCPSGRKGWVAEVSVTVPGGTQPETARFPLTVAE